MTQWLSNYDHHHNLPEIALDHSILPQAPLLLLVFLKTIMTPSQSLAFCSKSPLHCHAFSSVSHISTSIIPSSPPWLLFVCPARSKIPWDLSESIFHNGTSRRVTRSKQEEQRGWYHPQSPISLWTSLSGFEYFTSVQNRQKDYTGMAFAKTHVLNIWNSVFGIETEREIFNPASVMGKRLLVGLKDHAKLRACSLRLRSATVRPVHPAGKAAEVACSRCFPETSCSHLIK